MGTEGTHEQPGIGSVLSLRSEACAGHQGRGQQATDAVANSNDRIDKKQAAPRHDHDPIARRFPATFRLGRFQSPRFRARCCGVPGRPKKKPEGVVIRHSTGCASRDGARCNCRPGYEAQVYSAREGRTIRMTFRTLADARAWRAETQSALHRGAHKAPSRTTVAESIEEWIKGAREGVIRTRLGRSLQARGHPGLQALL
jgi:hypothetical protein